MVRVWFPPFRVSYCLLFFSEGHLRSWREMLRTLEW